MKNTIMFVTVGLATVSLFGQTKEEDRLDNSAMVLKQTVNNVNNGLSPAILGQALCVAIFPSVKKVAVGIGGSYGRGVLVCRKNEELGSEWSAPVMYSLDQSSIGVQLGSTATDFVLVIMKKEAAERALNGKTKLGSDAAVAAGPVGAQATAYSPEAAVLTYSRTKGVFAGVSLSGATVDADRDANKAVYGKLMTAHEIVSSAPIVPAAKPLVDFLDKTAPPRSSTGG